MNFWSSNKIGENVKIKFQLFDRNTYKKVPLQRINFKKENKRLFIPDSPNVKGGWLAIWICEVGLNRMKSSDLSHDRRLRFGLMANGHKYMGELGKNSRSYLLLGSYKQRCVSIGFTVILSFSIKKKINKDHRSDHCRYLIKLASSCYMNYITNLYNGYRILIRLIRKFRLWSNRCWCFLLMSCTCPLLRRYCRVLQGFSIRPVVSATIALLVSAACKVY